MKLQGCGTALVTPFRADRSIDEPCLRELVEWQIASGIEFLVPCGTTGETPTLGRDTPVHQERGRRMPEVVKAKAGLSLFPVIPELLPEPLPFIRRDEQM